MATELFRKLDELEAEVRKDDEAYLKPFEHLADECFTFVMINHPPRIYR